MRLPPRAAFSKSPPAPAPLTRLLRKRLPDAAITASDLNQAMLDVAAKIVGDGIEWRQADASDLPFPDQSFDAVVCQFGVMFFPDKVKAFAEARRVLVPGGVFHFNVWDKVATCDFARVVTEAMAELYPKDPPTFFPRVPHGYSDETQITRDLKAAGFKDIEFENIEHRSISPSALEAAKGLCEGTPLRAEIEARKSPTLDEATRHATEVFHRTLRPGRNRRRHAGDTGVGDAGLAQGDERPRDPHPNPPRRGREFPWRLSLRLMLTSDAWCPPPPCGEGLGVGVAQSLIVLKRASAPR